MAVRSLSARPTSLRSVSPFRPPRPVVRGEAGLWAYEAALQRNGFMVVAGADEAGRGACAGPLVVASCVLPATRFKALEELDDSKALTAAVRERLYGVIMRKALSYRVVVIPHTEIDAYGLHVANLAGMRRALISLDPAPTYALTDGFAVPRLPMPATAVWKGDAVVACIAAASILAKVTRDRIMADLHDQWPQYGFAGHKGYITPEHTSALLEHGPSPVHRNRYVNVRRAALAFDGRELVENDDMSSVEEEFPTMQRLDQESA